MHSFLSCFINMHSVLIGWNDKHIPQISSAVLGVGGKNTPIMFFSLWTLSCSDSVTLVGCCCNIYVLPMKRPTSALLCFCERFSQRPQCLVSTGFAQHTQVQSSVVGLFFVAIPNASYSIPDLYPLYKQDRNWHETTPSNHTLTWLFKTFWW